MHNKNKENWAERGRAYPTYPPPTNPSMQTTQNHSGGISQRWMNLFPIRNMWMIKLFINREQIRLLNTKSTDLDWNYSRSYQKLKYLVRDLLVNSRPLWKTLLHNNSSFSVVNKLIVYNTNISQSLIIPLKNVSDTLNVLYDYRPRCEQS